MNFFLPQNHCGQTYEPAAEPSGVPAISYRMKPRTISKLSVLLLSLTLGALGFSAETTGEGAKTNSPGAERDRGATKASPATNDEKPNAAAPVAPLQTEFIYEAIVSVGAMVDVGPTPLGHRRYIPITGGSFEGPRLRGTVLSGGADWQIERSDGVTEADALYSIRADDGTVIIVRNQGVIAGGGAYMRTALRFTAPNGPHAWLNQYQFVSSIAGGPRPGTVIIRVFRVL